MSLWSLEKIPCAQELEKMRLWTYEKMELGPLRQANEFMDVRKNTPRTGIKKNEIKYAQKNAIGAPCPANEFTNI